MGRSQQKVQRRRRKFRCGENAQTWVQSHSLDAKGDHGDRKAEEIKHAVRRAHIAKMSERKVQSPANKEGEPTTNRCRRMTKLAARLRELQNSLTTNDKYIAAGKTVSGNAERQRQQLWTNITKEAVEDLPYAQWLEEGKWRYTRMPPTKTVEHCLNC